jgi:hypothetical protein
MGSGGLMEEIHNLLVRRDFNVNVSALAEKYDTSQEHVVEMGYYVLEKEILPDY